MWDVIWGKVNKGSLLKNQDNIYQVLQMLQGFGNRQGVICFNLDKLGRPLFVGSPKVGIFLTW